MQSLLKLTFFCPNELQVFASLKKLAMKFEAAQIIRKSTQANASHCKLVVTRGTIDTS